MNIAVCFVWTGGLIWVLFFKDGKAYRLIAWVYITVIALLVATNGKDYYALGTYPMLFAAGGVWLQQITAVKRYWFRYVAVSIMLLLFVPIIPVLLPVWMPEKLAAYYHKAGFDKTGATHWEDQKDHDLPQDFADMTGWKELATKMSATYAALADSVKANTIVYGRNYALAGAMSYYGKGLPQVHTDNASFLFWMPDTYHISTLLFAGKNIPDKDDEVFQQFEKYTVLDSITSPYARERGVKIILYEHGNTKVNGMIEKGIKEMKDEYRR